MRSILLLLLPVLFVSLPGAAQQDLRTDSVFFQQQVPVYQDWLNRSGFGQILKVQKLLVYEEYVVLNLGFRSNDLREMFASWKGLKEGFEEVSPVSLEEKLFYQAASVLELQDTMLAVGIYDTYNRFEVPTFKREILFIEGAVRVEEDNPKAAIEAIKLFPRDLQSGTLSSVAKFQQKLSREKVYDCIRAHLIDHFSGAGYGAEAPEIEILEERINLRLKVTNLRKEVLGQSNLCSWLEALGLDCRWAKREQLTFLFTYEPTSGGIQLTGDISGKVGSGLYREVPRGSYRNLEPEFNDELQAYIATITAGITKHLASCN